MRTTIWTFMLVLLADIGDIAQQALEVSMQETMLIYIPLSVGFVLCFFQDIRELLHERSK